MSYGSQTMMFFYSIMEVKIFLFLCCFVFGIDITGWLFWNGVHTNEHHLSLQSMCCFVSLFTDMQRPACYTGELICTKTKQHNPTSPMPDIIT